MEYTRWPYAGHTTATELKIRIREEREETQGNQKHQEYSKNDNAEA